GLGELKQTTQQPKQQQQQQIPVPGGETAEASAAVETTDVGDGAVPATGLIFAIVSEVDEPISAEELVGQFPEPLIEGRGETFAGGELNSVECIRRENEEILRNLMASGDTARLEKLWELINTSVGYPTAETLSTAGRTDTHESVSHAQAPAANGTVGTAAEDTAPPAAKIVSTGAPSAVPAPSGQSAESSPEPAFPRIDLIELSDSFQVYVDLPGAHKDAVSVQSFDKGTCVEISGDIGSVHTTTGDTRIRERHTGKFSRTLKFDNPIDPSKADAQLADGILRLVMQKRMPTTLVEVL
ncbi:hypothetical protein HK101_009888, partial [Irineochytrium annulatum]